MIQQEGPGWQLARDPSRVQFPVLVGGEGWAFELTELEWTELAEIIFDLIDQLSEIDDQLMPEELVCLEIERSSWWCCIDGEKDSWDLQLVLKHKGFGARGVEASWPAPAAQAIAAAMRIVWDSYH